MIRDRNRQIDRCFYPCTANVHRCVIKNRRVAFSVVRLCSVYQVICNLLEEITTIGRALGATVHASSPGHTCMSGGILIHVRAATLDGHALDGHAHAATLHGFPYKQRHVCLVFHVVLERGKIIRVSSCCTMYRCYSFNSFLSQRCTAVVIRVDTQQNQRHSASVDLS